MFIGRDLELELMRQYLAPGTDSNRRRICVLHGLGGIGKTQLAIEYMRLHKHMYTSVFWLDGKTENSLLQSLIAIAFRLPKDQVSSRCKDIKSTEELEELSQEVLRWFALEGNHDWLLIFDNVDKTSTLAPHSDIESLTTYDIKSFFPSCDRGSVVITTRINRLMKLGNSIKINKLDTKHGMMLFESARGNPVSLLTDSNEGSNGLGLENHDSGLSPFLFYPAFIK